jgi:hypothetical protein
MTLTSIGEFVRSAYEKLPPDHPARRKLILAADFIAQARALLMR